MASVGDDTELFDKALTLRDLCDLCHVEEAWLAALVAHGSLQEAGPALYASSSLVRVSKAKRLVHDFDLNPAGVALVLELLDEIERLRRPLR